MCNNTALLCLNISQERCNVAAMADGITDLIMSVISTASLIGLFLGLRREAWNTLLKRLSLLLCTFYGINGVIFASVELYNDLLPEVWCKVFFFVEGYTSFTIFMYVIVIVSLFLIQSGAPVVPRHWRLHLLYRYAFWLELIFHLILHVVSLSLAAVEIFSSNGTCKQCESGVHGQYFRDVIKYIFVVFALIGIVINIILLGYFYIKFCRAPSITRRSRWFLLRLSTMFLSLVSLVVFNILLYFVQTYYIRLIVEAYVIATTMSLVSMLTLLALVYLPNIQCCNSCMRSPDQAPLLPNSNANTTNPPSVWDHNVPSYTFYSPPPEMSDYMTSAQYEPTYAQ